jgi:glucokinase
MLYVTSSTGVGAGVILNGRLLHGHWSLAEAGHMVIDRHSGETVERLGSGTALGRLAGEDAASVEAKARAGDAEALAQFRQVADAFAIGVVNLVHCFMPERVVIGGGMAQAGDLLLDSIRDRLARCASSCSASRADVAQAQLGDDAGLLGAFVLGLESMGANGAPPGLAPAMPEYSAE